ncbi:MAG: alpha/beta fold hydrolase [Clostridiales bacterium]|nr:alpha/beta fold hydrolase [Clostridiales bacterium]
MDWVTVLIIIAVVILILVLPMPPLAAWIVWRLLLVRTKPEKWGRKSSFPNDPEYQRLFDEGAEWGKAHEQYKQPVTITSDGFKLAGEYFDFGYDRAVIIIAGRTEGCNYSYFFAPPYERSGFNVLVIDNRSHGLSEGKYNAIGCKEYRDIIEWSRMLHDKFGNTKVVCHGICIGASTALNALVSDECPEWLAGMISEGMYTRFYEPFKLHMIEQKRPIGLGLWILTQLEKHIAGGDMVHDGPIFRIDRLTKPILMIHSRKDSYARPENAVLLYDKCGSTHKHMAWMESGEHSRSRLVHPEAYDGAIEKFLAEEFGK